MDVAARFFFCVIGPIIGLIFFAVFYAITRAGKQHDEND